MAKCASCGRELVPLDVSFTLKLCGKGTPPCDYLCKTCVGEKFGFSEEYLGVLAEKWRREGCALFQTGE